MTSVNPNANAKDALADRDRGTPTPAFVPPLVRGLAHFHLLIVRRKARAGLLVQSSRVGWLRGEAKKNDGVHLVMTQVCRARARFPRREQAMKARTASQSADDAWRSRGFHSATVRGASLTLA